MSGTEESLSVKVNKKRPSRKSTASNANINDIDNDIPVGMEGEVLRVMTSVHYTQQKSLRNFETKERQRRLAKMEAFVKQFESNSELAGKMRMILDKLSCKYSELAFDRWKRLKEERLSESFIKVMHKKLYRRGKLLKRLESVKRAKHAENLLSEGDEFTTLWSQICRKQVPKAARIMSQNIGTRLGNSKKIASLCAKEQQKAVQKQVRSEARDVGARSKKAMREMLQFWKRNEKEEKELRKRAEKEAAERRRQEEEEREARRQNKKLQFLITQTELYSHFIAKKTDTSASAPVMGKKLAAGVDFADLDDSVIHEQANLVAQKAVEVEREKMKRFDLESDQARREAAVNIEKSYQDSNENVKNEGVDEMDFKEPSTLTSPLASTTEVRQPRMLQCQLKGYQIKGLTWLANLYEQGINGILADEMGLGKTVQAISLMAHLAETHNIWGPFLVIAPASTLHNWQQEIAKFVPSMRALPYWGNVNDRKTLRKFWNAKKLYSKDSHFHILITSYQLVVSDEKYFQRIKWQYMILDEAQAIKSSSSVRWKTLLSFQCRNRLLLTGTPIQNSMQELWALLHFIMPGLFDSHDEFSEWFSRDIENHAVSADSRSGSSSLNEHQLQRLHMILKPFMLRRVKKDVENELGEKIEIDVDCYLTGRQRSMYRGIKEKLPMAELLRDASTMNSDNLMNIVMQFRKVCNHPELFERSDIESPFVLHQLDAISPVERHSAGPIYYDGPLRNPLSLRIPKLILEIKESSHCKFLEFESSIYHPANIEASRKLEDDPFAVTRFSSVMSRGDIPLLLRRGPLGFGMDMESKKNALQADFFGHPDYELPNLLMDVQSTSDLYLTRAPCAFVPPVIASPISLQVDDINWMLEKKMPYISSLTPNDESGRHILMPNLSKLMTDCGKMQALDKLLVELKEGGHRVLIYNQMTRMIDLMEDYLHFRGYSYIRLDGSSKIADRRDLVNDWQSRPEIFIFLLSTRAGGLGINLTAADTVIFYDSDWNPTVDQQAMDRAHRLGQTKQVTVYRLITRHSIEERMRQRAKQKDEIHKVVISGGEFKQDKPNQKDIVSLLLLEDEEDSHSLSAKRNFTDASGAGASASVSGNGEKRTRVF